MFIDLMEVVDVPIIGSSFTWLNMEGFAGSIQNMFILCEGDIYSWKLV